MFKKIAILILLFLCIQLFSQIIEVESGQQEPTCKPFIEFYADNYVSAVMAGRGYTGVADIGNITLANINPASLDIKDDAQMYYEFGTKNETDFFDDIDNTDYKLEKYRSGVSTGFAYRVSESIQAGIIYTKKNSYAADFGEVHNLDYQGNIIASFPITEKILMHSVNIPVSYIYEKFRFGLGLNFDIYHSENMDAYMDDMTGYFVGYSGELDFVLFRPKLGVIYLPKQNLSLGCSFLIPLEKKLTTNCSWGNLVHDRNKFPIEILVGTKYSISSFPLSILLDFEHKHYSDLPEFLDSNNIHFGLEYVPMDKLQIRTGAFTYFDIRDTDYTMTDYEGNEFDFWLDSNSYEDKKFLTFGLSYLWKRMKFDLAVMDSSLLTDSDLKQTYMKIGCTLELEKR